MVKKSCNKDNVCTFNKYLVQFRNNKGRIKYYELFGSYSSLLVVKTLLGNKAVLLVNFDCYNDQGIQRHIAFYFQALFEAYRVLKPGGRFLCLEFSHVSNPILGPLYELYSFQVNKSILASIYSFRKIVMDIRKYLIDSKYYFSAG